MADTFARGIFPDPRRLFKAGPLREDQKVQWHNRPADGLLTGLTFTDGSAIHPTIPGLRRAGWSLVMVSPTGECIAAAFGAVPEESCPDQSSRDGEDYAYFMARQLVRFPATFLHGLPRDSRCSGCSGGI